MCRYASFALAWLLLAMTMMWLSGGLVDLQDMLGNIVKDCCLGAVDDACCNAIVVGVYKVAERKSGKVGYIKFIIQVISHKVLDCQATSSEIEVQVVEE